MGDVIVKQTQNISKSTKNVETEIKNSIKNINIDLSKLDMTGSIDSFKRIEEVSKAANFDGFIAKIVLLQETFINFQKAVQTANTSVTNFSKSSDKLQGNQSVAVTNVEINTGDISAQVGDITTDVSASVGDMTANLSASATAIGNSFAAIGTAALDFGNGVAIAVNSVSGLIDSIANLFTSFQALGQGLISVSVGIAALIPLLPQLGVSMLEMAINMSGILVYLPELLVFLGVLFVLSLLGEGLMAAGTGLLNIGLGLTSMTEGMMALLEFMPIFIASLAGITDNVGGIILFVLLAAAMLVMAIAMQMMNEQLTQFVSGMVQLTQLMSVGFVAAFVVFGAMLIGMSFFMDKVAGGIEKITTAIGQQITKLAILNPLLAAQAILMNPIVGGITVAASIVGALLVKALIPAMATGGVATGPTVAMVGEGRYPEAVVPLGGSPQFASMKSDIANAVLQGIMALNGRGGGRGNSATEIVLNVDGTKLARAVLPGIEKERSRGYSMAVQGV